MRIFNSIKSTYNKSGVLPLLFFDIETVRSDADFTVENTALTSAWAYQRRKEGESTFDQLSESYKQSAPLYAEFSKVLCVSFGFIKDGKLIVKSFVENIDSATPEKDLLVEIAEFISQPHLKDYKLTGHSIKGYDIPFLCRRMIANGIEIPDILDVSDRKPWEVPFFDIAEIWRMNGFYPASLTTMCLCLGIESSKSDNIDGSKIGDIYYGAGKKKALLKQIQSYCNEDVLATANCTLRMMCLDIVNDYTLK